MRHAYQVIIATTWHYILAKPNPRLLKYQLLTAHTHAATVKDQHRCNGCCSTSPAASAKASLDYEAACQETSQARRRCGCQQDGTHRLGDHGQRRILSSAGACCSHLKRLGNGSMTGRRRKTIELRG